jgi:type II secretory pathway pseudopilin PulG
MARETRSRKAGNNAAFTLVELLLTVALMLLLAGAVIINFGTLDRSARLEEGAAQVETLFRYSRAQAASTGRQLKIVFGATAPQSGVATASTNQSQSLSATNSGIQVLWEPDPLEAPGRFEPFLGAAMLADAVNDLVTVWDARQPGTNRTTADYFDAASLPSRFLPGNTNGTMTADSAIPEPPSLRFYPDGSSDSLEVVLSAAGGDDPRLAVVTLSGVNGGSRHRLISPVDGTPAKPIEHNQVVSGREQ